MARPLSSESVFRALAHPTRRSIVLALRSGESPASKILPNNLSSKPAVSMHLRALQHAGVISFRRKGTSLIYHINRQALRPVEQFLDAMNSSRG